MTLCQKSHLWPLDLKKQPAWLASQGLSNLFTSSLCLTIWIDFLHLPLYLVTVHAIAIYWSLTMCWAVLEIPQKTKMTWLLRAEGHLSGTLRAHTWRAHTLRAHTQRALEWTEETRSGLCFRRSILLLCWEGAAMGHSRRLLGGPDLSPPGKGGWRQASARSTHVHPLTLCNEANLCSHIPFYHCTPYSTICHLHLSISVNMELYHNFNLFVLVLHGCIIIYLASLELNTSAVSHFSLW